jgi:hypothetical protein
MGGGGAAPSAPGAGGGNTMVAVAAALQSLPPPMLQALGAMLSKGVPPMAILQHLQQQPGQVQ